jgi:isopenicillin N synthase-like dioxygenase
MYNIPKFTEHFEHRHPKIINDHLAEIEEFTKVSFRNRRYRAPLSLFSRILSERQSLHVEVLDPLHVLLAIALELPEDYFTSIHKYQVRSEDHLRYMMYRKYSPEQFAQLSEPIARGHTDLGSWTLLFRQPVAGLQIKDYSTNEWKWVKPQDATLTVNACDALNLLTAGYVKSTIHRVVVPPKDQQHVDRLGLLYFSRPRNDLKLSTITESPLLQREGFTQNRFEATGNLVPTMEGMRSILRTSGCSFMPLHV